MTERDDATWVPESGAPGHEARTFWLFLCVAIVSAVFLPVDPWLHDGWYQSAQLLLGTAPGADNYAPISAPAVQYFLTHELAQFLGLDLAGEFYLSAILQNVMLAVSISLTYCACTKFVSNRLALLFASLLLVFCISTGLAQSFLSENSALLLTSIWLYLLVDRYADASRRKTDSWLIALVMAACFAALVLTRMVPLLLLISFTVLFWGRLGGKRLFAEVSLNLVCCGALIGLLMVSNVERFGRMELTSTTGRHMWQGVMEMSDEALGLASGYQQLKRIDPDVHGKHWWELPWPDASMDLIEFDAFLKQTAFEAILNSPFEYLGVGIQKFIYTIGVAPYRVGFQDNNKTFNPLSRDTFLPPIAGSVVPPLEPLASTYTTAAAAAYWALFYLYPVAIVFLSCSLLLMVLSGVKVLPDPWSGSSTRAAQPLNRLAAFLVFGFGGILGLIFSYSQDLPLMEKLLICAIAGAFVLIIIGRWLRRAVVVTPSGRTEFPGILFGFMAFSFFGVLLASWQIETANSRNAVPLLPFLVGGMALGMRFWRETLQSGAR